MHGNGRDVVQSQLARADGLILARLHSPVNKRLACAAHPGRFSMRLLDLALLIEQGRPTGARFPGGERIEVFHNQ